MKRIASLLLVFVLVLGGLSEVVDANRDHYTLPYGDFLYYEDNGCMIITKYTGIGDMATIPSQIEGKPVTALDIFVFDNSANLTTVNIPSSVISIHSMAFSTCGTLIHIDIDKNNPNYASVDGVLFNKEKTELIFYPEGKSGIYCIPDGVKSIQTMAFSHCDKLTAVAIPKSVLKLGNDILLASDSMKKILIDKDAPCLSYVNGMPTLMNNTVGASIIIQADLLEVPWATPYILTVIDEGLMQASTDAGGILHFRPKDNATRAEIAEAIFYYLGLELSGANLFDDTKDHPARGMIAALAQEGILKGVNDNSFDPDKPVTRAEVATILSRALKPSITVTDFLYTDDSSIYDWARESVYTAYAYGWMKGDEAGTFRPQDNVSRAETAVVFGRQLEERKQAEQKPQPTPVAIPPAISASSLQYNFLEGTRVSEQGQLLLYFIDHGKELEIADTQVSINGISLPTLNTPYTLEQVKQIFGNIDVQDTTLKSLTTGWFGSKDYKDTDLLTPLLLLQILCGDAHNLTFDKVVMNHMTGSEYSNSLVAYTTNKDDLVDIIYIPIKTTDSSKILRFNGTYAKTSYNANTRQFDNGMSISENTKILKLYQGGVGYGHAFVEPKDLRSGTYTANFYNNTPDGIGVVLFAPDHPFDGRISISYNISTGIDQGETVNMLNYYNVSRAEKDSFQKQQLPIDQNVLVTGVKNDLKEIDRGDVILFTLNTRGRIDQIHILCSLGSQTTPVPGEADYRSFKDKLSIVGFEDDIVFWDDPFAYAHNGMEIWFGYIYKSVTKSSSEKQICLVDIQGFYHNYVEVIYEVPDTAKIILYKPNVPEAMQITFGSLSDIQMSVFPKKKDTTGDNIEAIDFTSPDFKKENMKCAFVKSYNGTVTEVVVVDYSK